MDNPNFSAPIGDAPPPLAPPPVIAPPRPPRKSRGWMIAAVILMVFLAFSLFGNLTQFFVNALSFKRGVATLSLRHANAAQRYPRDS